MFKDFIYYLEKLYVIIAIYIYTNWQKTMANRFLYYIYNMAKLIGKSF